MSVPPVFETSIDGVAPHRRGKVRDLYDVGDRLLMVATDRISAYDLVLGSAIPDKGKVLTQLSAFWFAATRHIVDNHMVSTDASTYPPPLRADQSMLAGRSMLVRRTTPVLIECVARGYLAGSGWKEYRENGRVCGIALPPGLRESDRLPHPIFTPATKADTGHDINISEDQAADLIGRDLVTQLRDLTLALYAHGAAHAAERGIIVADSKFEFGLVGDLPVGAQSSVTGTGAQDVLLIDEVLTPDSSRFWPAAEYAAGGPQPSFDKQYVRDYLDRIAWDRQPPVPTLPAEVVDNTRAKYLDAYRLLTGRELG